MSTVDVLRFAWESSGGVRAMLKSFDFRLAILVWLLASPTWLSTKWPDQVVAVLPNLLGFTLGGFAIFLGFGSDAFKGAIVTADEKKSPYLSVSSAFMLFVSVQLAALLTAVVAIAMFSVPPPDFLSPWVQWIAWASKFGSAFGYFLFCYSLALVLRAAVRIFRLSRWYNTYITTLAAASVASTPDKDGKGSRP